MIISRPTYLQYPIGTANYFSRLRMRKDTEERGAPIAVKEHDPLPRELRDVTIKY